MLIKWCLGLLKWRYATQWNRLQLHLVEHFWINVFMSKTVRDTRKKSMTHSCSASSIFYKKIFCAQKWCQWKSQNTHFCCSASLIVTWRNAEEKRKGHYLGHPLSLHSGSVLYYNTRGPTLKSRQMHAVLMTCITKLANDLVCAISFSSST